MRKMKFFRITGIAMLLLAAAASAAHAHAVVLWCYVEKGQVYVEGSFMGGDRKAQNSAVIVVNDKGDKILEGRTDKEGKFTFVPPYQGDMTVILKVDESHDADFELTKEDFLEAAAEEQAAGQKKTAAQ
jgi:nickel transport protein